MLRAIFSSLLVLSFLTPTISNAQSNAVDLVTSPAATLELSKVNAVIKKIFQEIVGQEALVNDISFEVDPTVTNLDKLVGRVTAGAKVPTTPWTKTHYEATKTAEPVSTLELTFGTMTTTHTDDKGTLDVSDDVVGLAQAISLGVKSTTNTVLLMNFIAEKALEDAGPLSPTDSDTDKKAHKAITELKTAKTLTTVYKSLVAMKKILTEEEDASKGEDFLKHFELTPKYVGKSKRVESIDLSFTDRGKTEDMMILELAVDKVEISMNATTIEAGVAIRIIGLEKDDLDELKQEMLPELKSELLKVQALEKLTDADLKNDPTYKELVEGAKSLIELAKEFAYGDEDFVEETKELVTP